MLIDGQPPISNVNYVPGEATANLAIVAPGDDATCVYVHSDAHVIVDLQAELVDDREIGMRPVAPHRLHDSRRDEHDPTGTG
jgi:hypothetical protein